MKHQRFREFAERFAALSREYGTELSARRVGRKWQIFGPDDAKKAFIGLVAEVALEAGFHGTEDQSVHWWLNCISGRRGLRLT